MEMLVLNQGILLASATRRAVDVLCGHFRFGAATCCSRQRMVLPNRRVGRGVRRRIVEIPEDECNELLNALQSDV